MRLRLNFAFLHLFSFHSFSLGESVHFLWIRCREDFSFISDLPVPIHIVEKCDEGSKVDYPSNVISVTSTPNLGDEAVGYFKWIMVNYDKLPTYTVFAHGEHIRSFLPFKTLLNCIKDVEDIKVDSYFQLNSGSDFYFRRRRVRDEDLRAKRAARYQYYELQKQGIENFPNLENATLHTYWGATWLISSVVIQKWPLKFYEACYQAALDTSIPQVSSQHDTLYSRNGVPGHPRHTEIGGFYEHAFYVILNGGSVRNKKYRRSDFKEFFDVWCIPYGDKEYLRKYRKFKPQWWEKYLREKYPQKFLS